MSPVSPVFHTEATAIYLGQQGRVKTDFQTEVKTLVHLHKGEQNWVRQWSSELLVSYSGHGLNNKLKVHYSDGR